jgi:hypothetical protein
MQPCQAVLMRTGKRRSDHGGNHTYAAMDSRRNRCRRHSEDGEGGANGGNRRFASPSPSAFGTVGGVLRFNGRLRVAPSLHGHSGSAVQGKRRLPPGGDCPTPVRFDLYPGGRVLIYTEDGERRLAEVTANHEARFTVALSPGTYLVMPDNGMRNGDLVTVPPTGYAETDVQDYIPPP